MAGIIEVGTLSSEIVLTERIVSTEFKIIEVFEQVVNRRVRAEVELGPFVTEEGPGGVPQLRGSSRRGVTVWENEAYDAIRDTWNNTDLIAAVTAALNG